MPRAMGNLGTTGAVIAGMAMLFYGTSRLVAIGKGLGKGIRGLSRRIVDTDDLTIPELLPLDDPGDRRPR